MSEIFVYQACYADGYEEVRILRGKRDLTAFESELRERTAWFYPIGKMEAQDEADGGFTLDFKALNELQEAWEASGSPKIAGLGEGPSPSEDENDEIECPNGQMERCLFYLRGTEDGDEAVMVYRQSHIDDVGGLDALEAIICKSSSWYSPIGELEMEAEDANFDNPEFPYGRVTPLIEAWIEKGAHTIKGALDPGLSEGTITPKMARRYFVYKFCEKDGRERVCGHSEAEVKEYGGVEALESAMSNHTSWYYLIGTLLIPNWVDGSGEVVQIPFRRIKALVDAWLAVGAPWKPGKYAGDLANPPKGHPLANESEQTSPYSGKKRDSSRRCE